MQISKVIPSGIKALPLVAALAVGTGTVCSAQTKSVEAQPKVITVSDAAQDTNKDDSRTINFDAGIRTFQFMNGSNMSAVSAGVSKSWDNLTGYFTVLGGYNFADKLPLLGTMGFFDYKYPAQPDKFGVSAEVYHESALNKNGYSQKFAVTPAKFNLPVNKKINLGLDPRMAYYVNSGQMTPKFEVLGTLSAQIYKQLSAYVIAQIYDVTEPSVPANYGINAGIIKSF